MNVSILTCLPMLLQECPALSDVEDLILQQDPYGPARDTSALLRGYGGFRSGLPSLGVNWIQSTYIPNHAKLIAVWPCGAAGRVWLPH